MTTTTYDYRPGRYRSTDPSTSAEGARSVAYRAGSQKALLLRAYVDTNGLTDEEAAAVAGLSHIGFWKRCAELRRDGFIEDTGTTRTGVAGVNCMVCEITEAGLDAAGAL
jgi:hypothetical protein